MDPVQTLSKEYPYIVWWGKSLGSYSSYILDQCAKAKRDGAPRTAIYEESSPSGKTGKWRTIHTITNEATLERLFKEFGNDVLEREKG